MAPARLWLETSVLSTDSWDFKQSTRNISPTINQANIVDLHPASVYSIRMYSFNKIGRSEPSKGLTVSTEEAGEPLALPGAWPWGQGLPGPTPTLSTGGGLAVRRGKRGGRSQGICSRPPPLHLLGLFQVGCSVLGFWELSMVLPCAPAPACTGRTDVPDLQRVGY